MEPINYQSDREELVAQLERAIQRQHVSESNARAAHEEAEQLRGAIAYCDKCISSQNGAAEPEVASA
jgi:hypothetical protein